MKKIALVMTAALLAVAATGCQSWTGKSSCCKSNCCKKANKSATNCGNKTCKPGQKNCKCAKSR